MSAHTATAVVSATSAASAPGSPRCRRRRRSQPARAATHNAPTRQQTTNRENKPNTALACVVGFQRIVADDSGSCRKTPKIAPRRDGGPSWTPPRQSSAPPAASGEARSGRQRRDGGGSLAIGLNASSSSLLSSSCCGCCCARTLIALKLASTDDGCGPTRSSHSARQ